MNEYVNEVFLPFYTEVKRSAERPLSLKEAEEKVKELHDFYKKAWELHFEIVMPRSDLGMILEELYGALTGDANTAYVYDLLEGSCISNAVIQIREKSANQPGFFFT